MARVKNGIVALVILGVKSVSQTNVPSDICRRIKGRRKKKLSKQPCPFKNITKHLIKIKENIFFPLFLSFSVFFLRQFGNAKLSPHFMISEELILTFFL